MGSESNLFSVATVVSPNKHPGTFGALAGGMGAAQPCPTCLWSSSWLTGVPSGQGTQKQRAGGCRHS